LQPSNRTPNAQDIMTKVVTDIAKVTTKHINLLLTTHEHGDHLSGFLQKFNEIKIDEVWFALFQKHQHQLATWHLGIAYNLSWQSFRARREASIKSFEIS
jgi:beta-lactamase superfamily II metal-dependent hydrolase